MGKLSLENIAKQMARVEAAMEDTAVISQYQSLSVREIIMNPDNIAAEQDTPESIEALADSIATCGLIHPLVVSKIAEHQYMLLSGERRYKAITTHLDWQHIPCCVYTLDDVDLQTVITNSANLETRDYTVAERLRLYQQLETALQNLKAKGKYKGGIGRGIAKIMGVTEQQIWKYKQLTSSLTSDEFDRVTNINAAVKKLKPSLSFSGETDPETGQKLKPSLSFSGETDPETDQKLKPSLSFSGETDSQEEQKLKPSFSFSGETDRQEIVEQMIRGVKILLGGEIEEIEERDRSSLCVIHGELLRLQSHFTKEK